MKRIIFIILTLFLLAIFFEYKGFYNRSEIKDSKNTTVSDLDNSFYEYCFDYFNDTQVVIETITTTPGLWLTKNPDFKAAINGVYWAADTGLSQGEVYLNSNKNLASGQGALRGFFVASKSLNKIYTTLERPEIKDGDLVIGTHPLLITDGKVSAQAQEDRYNTSEDFRSAIGYKNSQLCFTISPNLILMEDWAKELLKNGYTQAINLDGGSTSQLAIKDLGSFGPGIESTRMIIGVK